MFRLLVLAVVVTACFAEEEPQAAPDHYNLHRVDPHRLKEGLARLRADIPRIIDNRQRDDRQRDDRQRDDRNRDDRQRDGRRRDHHDNSRWWEHRVDNFDPDEPEGPVILRSIRPGGHTPDIARQNKIIQDVYSPDYAEPTWVLDYRYLKSGGRDYIRGPGGQIIILPKGITTDQHKEFKNYDELIEHLRLKNLAERKKPQYFMPLGQGAQYDRDDHRDRDHRAHDRHDDHRDRDHRGHDRHDDHRDRDHRGHDRHDDHGDMWKHRLA